MKQFSLSTRLFLLFIYIAGAAVLVRNLARLKDADTILLGVLCFLGAVFHILKVEGATNRSHYTLSFLVFGFTMVHLGMPGAILVILASNLAEWVWNRPPWFIQLFNISCYLIAAETARLVFLAINPSGVATSWEMILAIVAGMAGFTFVNHFLVGVIVWLARSENFKQSGVFALIPLLIDLTMMSIGASLAIVWEYNPYALLIFLIPAYPLYMVLKIPALERQTETDQKTGLFNHHYLMTQMYNELQRANRYDRPLSIIIADLDLLRNINNTYGHLAGDEVLKGMADILRQTVREYDLVARFGGEEFAILMPETEIEQAIERAEHIRKAIESARFVVPTSIDPIKATMSFGISKRENFEQTVEEIIHNADTALYRSKLSGRNTALAYVNNSYVKAGSAGSVQHEMENFPARSETHQQEKPTSEYPAASSTYFRKASANGGEPARQARESEAQINQTDNSKKIRRSLFTVNRYIAFLTATAVLASQVAITLSTGTTSAYSPSDWMGLAVIAFTIILTEWFSINLYVRNTSLSTSAVPILALVILFGPLGTLAASLVFALTAAIKFRSSLNRVIFNFSNHVIAGSIINMMIELEVPGMAGRGHPLFDLTIALAASLILFIFTTALISIGIGIDVKQSPYALWKEQYRWMAPYYLGIGFIAYALLFGYSNAGLPGVLIMSIPLALLRISQAQYVEHTRDVVNELRKKNQELEKSGIEIRELNEGLLITLSEIIDLRDPYVLGHSKQVSQYATNIAKIVGLNEKQTDLIRKAGLLHDIGKLGIPMEILTKPGKLTREEYELVKEHAALGGDLVKNSPSLRPLGSIIRHHHEFYNGDGYPDKLTGSQIPIEARIVAVADAIEAMSSDRPYRKALELNRIIKELQDHSGTQFDPIVVESAIKMLETVRVGEREASSRSDTQVRISQRFAIQVRTT